MKFILILTFISIFWCQKENKCNSKILVNVTNRIDSLDYNLIHKFFSTFSDSCSNNIEFSQFSNGLLFKIISKYPEFSLKCLTIEKDLNTKSILKELEYTLLDLNFEHLFENINNIKNYEIMKKMVLNSLKKAHAKYLKEG